MRLLSACLGLFGFAAAPAVAASPPAARRKTHRSAWRQEVGPVHCALNNGNLLEGAIRRIGARYQVAMPGGQIEVRASEVRFVAADRDDAYRRLRGTIAKDDAFGHLRLAHWCIRWQMLGYAAREILAAQDIDPKCPGIDPLERELRAATQAGQVTHNTRTIQVLRSTCPKQATARADAPTQADRKKVRKTCRGRRPGGPRSSALKAGNGPLAQRLEQAPWLRPTSGHTARPIPAGRSAGRRC